MVCCAQAQCHSVDLTGSEDYHMEMTAPDPAPTFFERVKDLLGIDEEEDKCDIHFPDAPGGAIFHGDDEESDDAEIQKYRNV